jgi:nucleoid DNA-binding protein
MLTIIPEELADGNIVELGDFGNFWLMKKTTITRSSRNQHPSDNRKLRFPAYLNDGLITRLSRFLFRLQLG